MGMTPSPLPADGRVSEMSTDVRAPGGPSILFNAGKQGSFPRGVSLLIPQKGKGQSEVFWLRGT